MTCRFLPIFTFIALMIKPVHPEFGDAQLYGVDDKFEVMGEARIAAFDIVSGVVHLTVEVEDTENKDELWVLDFQPYDLNGTSAVTTDNGGALTDKNTGTCSNIFNDIPFDSSSGFFKDSYEPVPPGSKDLFTEFNKGGSYVDSIRTDEYVFDGSIDTLFGCENTRNETVWERNVYNESIEFNTTLYMTNVRPRFTDRGDILPSYVESYAVLYWRLVRLALSRFIISSTERLRPIFMYAIVSTVYVNDDPEEDIDISRAEVEFAFKTVTDSDQLLSVYRYRSITYTSANVANQLSHVKSVPTRGCETPIGFEDGSVDDAQITASSFWVNDPEYDPSKGRLNAEPVSGQSAGAWVAGTFDLNQYIQVDLTTPTPVAVVITQGRSEFDQYVKTYKVQYSDDASSWTTLTDDDGNEIDFSGNYDSKTAVRNQLPDPIKARYFRLQPTTWENQIAMRIELLGCPDISPSQALEHNDVLYAPSCDFIEYPGQCTQMWYFTFVLSIDSTNVANNRPFDATGNFQFEYDTYKCDDLTTNGVTNETCELLDVPEAIISHEVTLQSTMELTDDIDSPSLQLKSVYGADPSIDLRDGHTPGISHLETLHVLISFFPEFLRYSLELDLTLFMVCIGREYAAETDGCLTAPDDERFAAYKSPNLYYEQILDPLNPQNIQTWYYEDIPDSPQVLAEKEYKHANEEYSIKFVNKALSSTSREYTITTIFRLVERDEGRKKRSIDENGIEKRDLKASMTRSHSSSFTILDRGCPVNSTHDPKYLDCICKDPTHVYSVIHFACVPKSKLIPTSKPEEEIVIETEEDDDDEPDIYKGLGDGWSSASVNTGTLLLFILLCVYSIL